MAATVDKSKPYFPLAGLANDGWSKDGEASATCFCGTVQLAFVCLFPLSISYRTTDLTSLHKKTGNRKARLSKRLPLQLQRLPQDNRQPLRHKLHRARYPLAPYPRRRQPHRFQPE